MLHSYKYVKGFTLTELMVAITLGIVLIAGVVEVYTGSKQTYRTQENLARLQESARLAMEILSREIRMAGNVGCENISNVTPTEGAGASGMLYDASFALWGTQSDGSIQSTALDNAPIRTALSGLVVDDSDILIVQSAGRCSMRLESDMIAADGNVTVAGGNPCNISRDDYAVISNCSSANLFQITSDPGSGILTPAAPIGLIYSEEDGSEVLTFSSSTYFIGTDTNGLPALFVMDNIWLDAPVALIEGVESMQVEYGIDTDDDDIPNRYVNANQAGNFTTVAAIRVTLLIRTVEDLGAQPTTFNAGGTNRTYDAGPIRQVFVTTIGLRNL